MPLIPSGPTACLCPSSNIAVVQHTYYDSFHFKLKTVGDQSFCSIGPRLWNSLPHSLRAGAVNCSDATPGTVTALLRLHLLATHFGGLSSNQTMLSPPSVECMACKRADSPEGSEHAMKKSSTFSCAGPPLCASSVPRKMSNVNVMYLLLNAFYAKSGCTVGTKKRHTVRRCTSLTSIFL